MVVPLVDRLHYALASLMRRRSLYTQVYEDFVEAACGNNTLNKVFRQVHWAEATHFRGTGLYIVMRYYNPKPSMLDPFGFHVRAFRAEDHAGRVLFPRDQAVSLLAKHECNFRKKGMWLSASQPFRTHVPDYRSELPYESGDTLPSASYPGVHADQPSGSLAHIGLASSEPSAGHSLAVYRLGRDFAQIHGSQSSRVERNFQRVKSRRRVIPFPCARASSSGSAPSRESYSIERWAL